MSSAKTINIFSVSRIIADLAYNVQTTKKDYTIITE